MWLASNHLGKNKGFYIANYAEFFSLRCEPKISRLSRLLVQMPVMTSG